MSSDAVILRRNAISLRKYIKISYHWRNISRRQCIMDSYNGFSDVELVALLKEGRQSAFAELYNRYKAALLLHAFRMLKDDEEARDIVQEMFAVLWAKRNQLVIKRGFDSYMYGALKNRILNIIAHKKVIEKYTLSLDGFVEAAEVSGDDLMIEKQLRKLIEDEIANLPPKMREIFELSRMEGLSHKQIAERLNISEHTVKSQVQNATKALWSKMRFNVLFLLYF
jgi:RNA polymerase sigma-70 factor (ECF subfamily)